MAVCVEIFLIAKGDSFSFARDEFVLIIMGLYVLFAALEYVFRLFVDENTAAVFSVLPGLFLLFLVKDTSIVENAPVAIVIAAILRIVLVFIPFRNRIILFSSFLLDAIAIFLCFFYQRFNGESAIDRILFICLVLLSLSAIQNSFPFFYFAIMGVLMFIMPMSTEPIDWTPAVNAYERVVRKAEDISYYVSMLFDNGSYTTGYSSLHVTGGKVNEDDKTQLVLTMDDKPYHIFVNPDEDTNMKVRRVIYLEGGNGADLSRFVSVLQFLHDNGIDKETASLFSRISEINIEYAYIDTCDEIIPANTFSLQSEGKNVETRAGKSMHKKGYELRAGFLDLDYGSTYFSELLRSSADNVVKEKLNYQQMCEYAWEIYGLDLAQMMSEKQYNDIISSTEMDDYLSTSGVSDRIKELSAEITSDFAGNYDKCKAIEVYLRQFPYSTNVEGNQNVKADMSTARGMAEIADNFLFQTQSGYCVHYTSAMVMLLRSAGIPARAVVGYRYEFPFDIKKSYEVSSKCAHLWPEAYIENVGWISFEPTGAYNTSDKYTWHRVVKVEKDNADDYYKAGIPGIQTGDPGQVNMGESSKGADDTSKEKTVTIEIIKIAVLVAICIILLITLIISGNIIIWRIRYRYGSPKEKFLMDVDQIKKSIKKKSENDFVDRGLLSDFLEKVPDENKTDAQKVFGVYYRIKYGRSGCDAISPEENNLAQNLRVLLKNNKKCS
ncbi:Transglutaminase-like superfamily protein [Butyrivibrio sp. YAB3001]|nr:Transglutaminase-like superfamily protein [Butyrivibrio sp. YAB3001]